MFGSILLAGNYDKYLSSEKKAEITIQKIVDDEGDFKKAEEFGIQAISVYNNNVYIFAYTGKAFYSDGKLSEAKNYFMKALDLDPTDEISSQFIKLIEEQESAKENKNVTSSLTYINDKGLDYLLIFLAFLGGEIIARRYSTCQAKKNTILVAAYVHKNQLNANFIRKILFVFSHSVRNPFCTFLSLLVILTTTVAITIVIVWMELAIYPFLIGETNLRLISLNEIGFHGIQILAILVIVFILGNLFNAIKSLKVNDSDIADILQNLALENNFKSLRECVEPLHNMQIKTKILSKCANNEAKEVLTNLFQIFEENE